MSRFNYFDMSIDGKRYAQARPDIHPTAIEKIRLVVGVGEQLTRVLDVGCGTGQSTIALTEIASSIVGIDPSTNMLTQAAPHPNINYCVSTAEGIPFSDTVFDLITSAQSFHWFDHDAFLSESSRVLRVPGWLVIYTSWFTSEMKEDPSFSRWFKSEYLGRFPTPPRNRTAVNEEIASKHGYIFSAEDGFSNELEMSIDRFVDYQLSTTNMIAAVEQGMVEYDDAAKWLHRSIEPYFSSNSKRTFLFWGKILYLEKANLIE